MQYSARGRKLTYSNKAIFQMVAPLLGWMALVILAFGLSYMFVSQSVPRLDDVNGTARVQAYSKIIRKLDHVLLLISKQLVSMSMQLLLQLSSAA